jgi:hypothetical protein
MQGCGGGPVGEGPDFVGYLRVQPGRQVVPDPRQDHQPCAADRLRAHQRP